MVQEPIAPGQQEAAVSRPQSELISLSIPENSAPRPQQDLLSASIPKRSQQMLTVDTKVVICDWPF